MLYFGEFIFLFTSSGLIKIIENEKGSVKQDIDITKVYNKSMKTKGYITLQELLIPRLNNRSDMIPNKLIVRGIKDDTPFIMS